MNPQDIELLDIITGIWRSHGSILAQNGEAKVKIQGTDAYEWVSGRQYLIHRIDVTLGNEEIHAVEIIGGYNLDKQAFEMHAFQNNTGHSVMWASKRSNDTWLFEGEAMRATLHLPNKSDPSRMYAKWDQLENGKWVHWMDMYFEK